MPRVGPGSVTVWRRNCTMGIIVSDSHKNTKAASMVRRVWPRERAIAWAAARLVAFFGNIAPSERGALGPLGIPATRFPGPGVHLGRISYQRQSVGDLSVPRALYPDGSLEAAHHTTSSTPPRRRDSCRIPRCSWRPIPPVGPSTSGLGSANAARAAIMPRTCCSALPSAAREAKSATRGAARGTHPEHAARRGYLRASRRRHRRQTPRCAGRASPSRRTSRAAW